MKKAINIALAAGIIASMVAAGREPSRMVTAVALAVIFACCLGLVANNPEAFPNMEEDE